ncbi:hypothetical protein D3Z58_07120 [Clostridiaceae bacterium]|nr:hypothetical protein [Clostridiaceae bacterium]
MGNQERRGWGIFGSCKERDFLTDGSRSLAVDVHSPGKNRVNEVLSAIDEFYETFDIKEGDGMYQKPEDWPEIW